MAMTKREFLTLVIAETSNEDIKKYALGEIAKMDEKNSKRKSTMNKTQVENETIKKNILEYLGTRTDITRAVNVYEDLKLSSTSKASSLLGQLVKSGLVEKYEVKIKGVGKVSAYRLPMLEDDTEEENIVE